MLNDLGVLAVLSGTSEYVEQLIDGWRKAGLEISPANSAATLP
jgi:hypothetical protein